MYCGRLEEALEYAEKGSQEEPDYPWIWLQVGKLRAHFGDKAGALDAVKQGLLLEPSDYEFLTLQQEIHAGATLEQMEYHWIDPKADAALQSGNDEDADDMLTGSSRVLSGWTPRTTPNMKRNSVFWKRVSFPNIGKKSRPPARVPWSSFRTTFLLS